MAENKLWNAAERKCIYLLQRKSTTFPSILQIHTFMLKNSLYNNLNLLTKFITTCGSLALSFPNDAVSIVHHARRVFDRHPENLDEFLCYSMINTHFAIHQFSEPFTLFRDLRREREGEIFTPGGHTFTALIKGCGSCLAKREGFQVHGVVVKNGFYLGLYVGTSLVHMYVKFGLMVSAKNVFDEMPERNLVVFNAMISGYCQNGDVDSARLMFDVMNEKDVFTWTAMIGGYCHNKRSQEALRLFRDMQLGASVEPNEITVLSVLPAVADLGALDWGGWIHRFVQRKRLDRYVRVCTALVDMYAKCGEIRKARLVFETMPEKETSSWNALLNGYAVNGHGKEALDVFEEMIQEGFKPDEITMLSVLSACNHCGLVKEGRKCFEAMEKFGLTPEVKHYNCMIALLGRAGCLGEAENLIQTMPYDANEITLSSFVFACGYFKDVGRAERVLKEAEKMGKLTTADYVMLRNLYATEQRWTDMEDVKEMMKKRGSYKEVNCSVIEVDGSFREFVAGDYLH